MSASNAQLIKVEFGRLVDVYGYQQHNLTLYQTDVLVGADIQDERPANSNVLDSDILFDFLSANPDTLQPRLFIPREINSDEFRAAFGRLGAQLRQVTPMMFGQGGITQPYTVVPRNAAIQLTFSGRLGITDDFFVTRNAQGQVDGLRNTEALQVLEIAGDPSQPNAFHALPARVVVRGDKMVIDPVLLGSEGVQYQARNNAAGLPASANQVGANIRVAIELEGSQAIPGMQPDPIGGLEGVNNSGRRSIIRDFRSGNANDDSADIARGFVRDPIPPRLVGEMLMYVERVDPVNAVTQQVTVFKNGINQEIDQGDVFKFVADNSGTVTATAEVVTKPDDDRNNPSAQHVRVLVRHVDNLELLDPSNLPGYPSNPADLGPWLVLNAPRAILVAEFSAGGIDPVTFQPHGDDPRYFVNFVPSPLPDANGVFGQPNENVSPFAGAVVRFTKPVDLTTVKPADTFFFATRNVLDQAAIQAFIDTAPWQTLLFETPSMSGTGMDPASFNADKFRTPHLIAASVFDEDGSQTALRLQPRMGFYLDDRMRAPQPGEDFRYYLHLLSGLQGIRDLAGNPIDLQADTVDLADHVVIPFSIDTRSNGSQPAFDNNLAVSVVRRFANIDEDENPSIYDPTEVQPTRSAFPNARPTAFALPDVFGSVIYLDGKLQARPTSRVRKIADNLNQQPFGSQTSPLRWCPYDDAGEQQFTGNTANTAFTGGGIQNPLNPYGCRLQTVWREIDLSLSRVDPFDFNLDVEQMYWAPFQGSAITFDELDRTSLFLGHSERRPEPCVGQFSSLSTYPDSGLATHFADNYVRNIRANSSQIESSPVPFAAYADVPLVMDASQSILEPNRVNRFLPLPQFRKPYFVYRDETVVEQGCMLSLTAAMGGSTAGASPSDLSFNSTKFPWILSPYANGVGRHVARADWLRAQPPPTSGNNYPPLGSARSLSFVDSCWNSNTNYKIVGHQTEENTEGLVGNVALPLLADFWTYCDSPDLPAGNGYVALGTNGWQIAITVQSGPQPYFRSFSSGHSPPNGGGPALCVGPGTADWNQALGGYSPGSSQRNVAAQDNSFYWIMIDFVKRATVATAGFVDLLNPHRVRPPGTGPVDPRLGPFFNPGASDRLPQGYLPTFGYDIDPPLSTLPAGTAIVPQFRGAGIVDAAPWYWDTWINSGTMYGPTTTDSAGQAGQASIKALLKPTADNFPLDPYKAGDAHIRKLDDRNIPGTTQVRNWWTYFYNRTVTGYFQDPNQLMDPAQLQPFGGPAEGFTPRDVRYINWRLLMSNNLDTDTPIAPAIDTFTFSYRFERTH